MIMEILPHEKLWIMLGSQALISHLGGGNAVTWPLVLSGSVVSIADCTFMKST